MNASRIFTLCKRYLATLLHLGQIQDMFFWPSFDIFVWGMAGTWLQRGQGAHLVAPVFLTALVLWQFLWRVSYEISVNLLEELWNRNLVNLFATPIKLSEWMVSLMCMGPVKLAVAFLFSLGLIYTLYDYNVLGIGWVFVPCALNLILSGWTLGFMSASCILAVGNRGFAFAWMVPYAFLPFSAVYYPVSVLPMWAQAFSKYLPMTYVLETARGFLLHGTIVWENLLIALGLNCLYLPLAMFLFVRAFERSRKAGLARLE